MIKRIVCIAVFVSYLIVYNATAQFYIAPHGNDDNTGMKEEPFATLTGARDAVRRSPARVVGRAGRPVGHRGQRRVSF